MNKKQLQTEQTKKRMLDAARALFVQKGFKATSIEDIVAATGSSKGNIYYHFKSKEGLFLYLLDEWNRDWEEKWKEKEHLYPTTVQKIYGLAEHLVRDDLSHPLTKAADEFFNSDEKDNDVEERVSTMMASHLSFNQQLIQQGIDSGEFKANDAAKLAIIMESLIIGLGQMSRQASIEEALNVYELAVTVMLYGIASPMTS
ncbi:TetR/AcrR family transcriptional regulator [Paenibacillus nuruki]|uniref:TetR/AcrR family transcriptional regulator n=1 Tax=Paenibacillus nuruki TaxID=1886670 RepID=UPI0028045513|nr:TetR/AcrR family transcriptional regulator [Paenibacillus nuruki]CAJ1316599.1 HTH-type transcriptional repressor KstR2 [Paenibacillus nuruki]